MGKSKKPRQISKNQPDAPQRIKFELEENAHELLLDHLDRVKPAPKDSDEKEESSPKARPRTEAARERSVDLHGFRLDEARDYLQGRFELWLQDAGLLKVRVITGKGLHSQSGEGVLAREIHRFVLERYGHRIQSIEASPDEVKISGLPIRGHFVVTLRGRSNSS